MTKQLQYIICVFLSVPFMGFSDGIVSLGSPVTEIIVALGADERLAGIDDSSAFSKALSKLPQVGYYRMVSAEGVLSVQPSLIISSEDAGPPEALKKIKDSGVPVIQVPADKSLEGTVRRIRAVGEALGAGEAAEQLLKPIEMRLENPLKALDPAPKVLFIYARGGGASNVSGNGTGAHEMIQLAGAKNAVEGFRGYRPLTPEALVASQPDVLLMTRQGLDAIGGEKSLWSLPGMQNTPAGKNSRIVVMDEVLLLGFGPRVVDAMDQLRAELTEE
ncbi:hemin ABC transporter substrate-binding protein [Kiritimatiellaeota bacterium B1221]|nr:hemin ABC transporter substrate-binding protein [Kiritimatiellaeota bacterium B1221]